MRFLFLLFIIIPIIEITVLINVGDAIGVWNTVGLVLLSAFIGVNMLRYQGISTLMRAQQRANQGEIPGQEMVEGVVLAVGGAMLITPGFVTDILGFCCLLPYTRKAFASKLMGRFTIMASQQHRSGSVHFYSNDPFNRSETPFEHHGEQKIPPKPGADVIDGEFERKD